MDYVALLRGINVGGKNSLPMKALRELLRSIGCEHVETYIQSGNAVFRHRAKANSVAAKLTKAIEAEFEFRPQVLVLPAAHFRKIVEVNPLATAAADPKHMHIWFFSEPAERADKQKIEALREESETVAFTDTAFYLHAPNGIGRSRLASAVEKCAGVPATARNSRTLSKILTMLDEQAG